MTLPTLDEDVHELERGHLNAHDALHRFYNVWKDALAGRLDALDVAIAGISQSTHPHDFSRIGPTTLLISAMMAPIDVAGSIAFVIFRESTAPAGSGADRLSVTKAGINIFDSSGPYAAPQLTAGQNYVMAVPNPARAGVVLADDVRVHVDGVASTPGANITGTIAILPTA